MTLTNIFNDEETRHYCVVIIFFCCQIELHYAVYCCWYFVFSTKPLVMMSSYAGDRSMANGLVVFMS